MQDLTTAKPLWRRVIDFPLVSLVIGVASIIAGQRAVEALKPYIPLTPKTPLSDFVRPMLAIMVAIVVYKLVVARLGARPRDELPLDGSGARQFGAGMALGTALIVLVVGIAWLLGIYRIAGPGDARDLAWAAFGMGLMPAVIEEILVRGIIFRWLEELAGSWAALAISSALFGLGHWFNPDATVLSTIAIAVEAGILFGALYMMTHNLWLCIGTHAAWNFLQGGVFGVPVSGSDVTGLVDARLAGDVLLSGGPFGLEASIITMVLLTTTGIGILARVMRTGTLVQPIWRKGPHSDEMASEALVD